MREIMNDGGGIELLDGRYISSHEIDETNEIVSELPITGKTQEIMDALSSSWITILEGATGSGKSTQGPQIAYEFLKGEGIAMNNLQNPLIVQSQPRVSAAMGVAERIWYEYACRTGKGMKQFAGYKTGKGHNFFQKGGVPISIQTSGHMLAYYAHTKKLPRFLMLDELHVGDPHTNMILHLALERISLGRGDLNLMIGGATINKEELLPYIEGICKIEVPIISVEGRTFPVEETHYQEQDFTKVFSDHYGKGRSILIFEDGKAGIKETISSLKGTVDETTVILPFHSKVSVEEQSKIRTIQTKDGTQVVIVATESAQESLTVPYLDTVIDKGYSKVASVDKNGISRLDREPCSLAAYKQRIGRVGRTKNGFSARLNKNTIENLEDFPAPQTSKMTLGKEILFYLSVGVDLREQISLDKKKGKQTLLHMPNEKLLKLSYERLFMIGAIDNNGLTELGEKTMGFPLSEFNAKVLLESIERGVSKDMLEVVALLENDGSLLIDGLWKKLFQKEKKSHKNSDIFFQLQIFRMFCSRDLDEKTLNFLGSECGFGFEWRQEYLKGERALYEFISEEKLEIFGINKRSLENILDTVEELERRCEKQGIELTSFGDKDDKIMSLLSGYPHHVFDYDNQKKEFRNYSQNWGQQRFTLGNRSIVEPNKKHKNGFFIGSPFIIGGEDGKEDFPLLGNIQYIEQRHLDAIGYQKIIATTPDFSLKTVSLVTQAKRELMKAIGKVSRSYKEISEKKVKKGIHDSMINNLKLEEDYQEILSWMGGLNHEDVTSLKARLTGMKGNRQELIRLTKQESWIDSFLNDISHLLQGEEVKISGVGLRSVSPEHILMTDPNIIGREFVSKIQKQRQLYFDIKKLAQSNFIENSNVKKAINMINFFQRSYGFDSRSRKRAVRNIGDYMFSLKTLDMQYNSPDYGRGRDKASMRNHHKNKTRLKKLITDLELFQENTRLMHQEISEIDFESVLYSHVGKKHKVFTKKYLYNIVSDIIFNGDALSLYTNDDRKIIEKLQQNLGTILDTKTIAGLVTALKILRSQEGDNRHNSEKTLMILRSIREQVETYRRELREKSTTIAQKIDSINGDGYILVFEGIKRMLETYFAEDYLEQNQGKIGKMAHKFIMGINLPIEGEAFSVEQKQKNYKKFDEQFLVLLQGLGISNSLHLSEYSSKLDEYNYLREHIVDYLGRDFKKVIAQNEVGAEELQDKIRVVEESQKKLSRLKKYFNDHSIPELVKI